MKHVNVRYQKVPTAWGEDWQKMEEPQFWNLPEIWEQEIRKLTQLPDRMLWYKCRGSSQAYLVEAPQVDDIEDLPDYHRLPELWRKQDEAAFKLAGQGKHPPVAYQLPAPDERDTLPISTDYIPLWIDQATGFSFSS